MALRRHELGLTIEQVAARTGMDPGYLVYIEHQVALPPPRAEAILRLARVLQTTTDELLGGRADLPPGRGAPAAHPRLVELEPSECRRLIGAGGVGRVVVSASPAPLAIPVNYQVQDEAILFRTAPETILADHIGGSVGFEVDHVDEAMKEGWSVLVTGTMHAVDPDAMTHDDVGDADVAPWAGGDRGVRVRIEPDAITGRRIITH